MNELMDNVFVIFPLLSFLVTGLVEAVKRTNEVDKKYLPLVAIAIGLISGLVIGYAQSGYILAYGLTGIFAGFAAAGIYDNLNKLIGGKQ